MLNRSTKWECVSETVKCIKERGTEVFIIQVDTRDVNGHEVQPNMDNPFLGEDVDLVLITDIFNRIRTFRWWWYKNSNCKYIRLSVDLRSKTCRIQDRNGNNITYLEFKHQWRG